MFPLEEDVNLPASFVAVDLFSDNMHFFLLVSSELLGFFLSPSLQMNSHHCFGISLFQKFCSLPFNSQFSILHYL